MSGPQGQLLRNQVFEGLLYSEAWEEFTVLALGAVV